MCKITVEMTAKDETMAMALAASSEAVAAAPVTVAAVSVGSIISNFRKTSSLPQVLSSRAAVAAAAALVMATLTASPTPTTSAQQQSGGEGGRIGGVDRCSGGSGISGLPLYPQMISNR